MRKRSLDLLASTGDIAHFGDLVEIIKWEQTSKVERYIKAVLPEQIKNVRTAIRTKINLFKEIITWN